MPIKADKHLRAYYNEIDPNAAQWLRNLMDEGWITKGDIDERSIEDVRPNELAGYDRTHFFSGIGVWDYALNQAGWGSRKVWTGSCPCQPFSAAGKGAGFADERHLWPAFNHLIQECRPDIVLGEQVASKDGLSWLDLVLTDLEAQGYAAGAVDTCAAGFGAPHIRQRLYWVGKASGTGLAQRIRDTGIFGESAEEPQREAVERTSVHISGLDDTNNDRYTKDKPRSSREAKEVQGVHWTTEFSAGEFRGAGGDLFGLADTNNDRCQPRCERSKAVGHGKTARTDCCTDSTSPTNGFWRDADWLGCRDGKWRPVEPGTFPLVNGTASRLVRLRAYGNAINAAAAQAFIECVMQ